MRDDRNQEIDRELSFHLEELTRAKMAEGIAAAEARRQAIIEFGGPEQVKQQVREVHVSRLLESFRANLSSAFRFIRRSPSFAVAIVLTLALGIGANTSVFSTIDAIVLRPLPFPQGDELVRIHQLNLKENGHENLVATQRVEDWNRLNQSYQVISGYYTADATYTAGPLPEKLTIAMVAPRFLRLWGVLPLLGRDFSADEEKSGGPNAVLISHRFWRTHLRADAGVIGRPISLSGVAFTVVGVLPESFRYPQNDIDVWEMNPPDAPFAQSRESTWFTVLGRLRPGITVAQAQADLATVQSSLGKQYPLSDGSLTVSVEPLKAAVIGGVQKSLWLFYGAVSLLLIIACTNIAALLMARTAEREHEIAIRYSLGASRVAIVSQLLTEVFVLALAGSMIGLLFAAGGAHLLGLLSRDLPRIEEVRLSWRVLAYSLGCALAATFASGLLPALRGTRRHLSQSLSHSGRTQVSGQNFGQWMLVGVQVSLAVTLLIVSGLLLRSFQALGHVDPGFAADHVLTLRISGGWGETADMGKLAQRIDRDLDALRSVPGVQSAATAATIPGNSFPYPIELKSIDRSGDPNQKIVADSRVVSAEYLSTLRIPLLQGEDCRDGLPYNSYLVNRSFGEKYFPGSTAIGHHLQSVLPGAKADPIVGMIGDVREEGLETSPQPAVYWCFSSPIPDPYFLIRTHGDPAAMADTLRRKIHEIEPARSVFGVMTLVDHLEDRQAENRLRTVLISLFAVAAIALVSIGLYGTISYLGRTRRREVGLRLALGAMPQQIVNRFLWQGLRVTVIGSAVGLPAGAAFSRVLGNMLYGISAIDPLTYLGVPLLMVAIALLASALPAIRAVQVDPTEMLREQ
jgi:putative ABC transport system permease protein